MNEQLYSRLETLEQRFKTLEAAPTFPIYSVADLPQDAVDSQIVIGDDDSINWYDGSVWNTYAGAAATPGIVPQDILEGQIVIGSDCSLCWYSNATWHGAPASLATEGILPQDVVDGQIVVGNTSLCWYCDGAWYGVSAS